MKILLTSTFFIFCFSLHSQLISPEQIAFEKEVITLYEYGQPIDSCECNFENLFRNWTTQFITNANDTKLMSYEFVELLDESNLEYYINWFTHPNALITTNYGYTITENSLSEDSIMKNNTKRTRYINYKFNYIDFANIPVEDHEKAIIYFEKAHNNDKRELREIIKINDKVYQIKFGYGGQVLKTNVICSSEKNSIIRDNLFNISAFESNIRLY